VTHDDLVQLAHKWLMTQRCGFAFKEIKAASMSGEIPDAIGFKSGCSILIECKTSRSDFLADKKKSFRLDPSWGMGDWRFMMCEKGLISKDELPEGWGLIEINKGKARRVHGGPKGNIWTNGGFPFKGYREGEAALMYRALRYIEIKGFMPEIYGNPYAKEDNPEKE
jgi:hypothetical protein